MQVSGPSVAREALKSTKALERLWVPVQELLHGFAEVVAQRRRVAAARIACEAHAHPPEEGLVDVKLKCSCFWTEVIANGMLLILMLTMSRSSLEPPRLGVACG